MANRTRDIPIQFFVTAEEKKMIRKKMILSRTANMGAYLRKMALDGYCIQLDIPEIKEMTALLGRCSGNLNQYAKKANQTGSIYAQDITDLRVRLDQIYDQTERILAALNALQY